MLKCRYCSWIGFKNDFEWDHMNPKLKTDSFLLDLLQGKLELICSGCNREKGDKTAEEYMVWRLFSGNQPNYGPIRTLTILDHILQRTYKESPSQ